MPTTYAIPNGRTVMDATLYTGTGSALTVNNSDLGTTGFQPDLVWIKSRSAATNNKVTDSVRGATKAIVTNSTASETTDTQGLTAFGTSGFTLGTDTTYNNSGATYVGWQWKAGGTAVSNTTGSITSSVSANTTAGFSVVTYTGTGVAATVGHGLGIAPYMIVIKERNVSVRPWPVYFAGFAAPTTRRHFAATTTRRHFAATTVCPPTTRRHFASTTATTTPTRPSNCPTNPLCPVSTTPQCRG